MFLVLQTVKKWLMVLNVVIFYNFFWQQNINLMSSPPKSKQFSAAQYVHNARKNQISALINPQHQVFDSKKIN